MGNIIAQNVHMLLGIQIHFCLQLHFIVLHPTEQLPRNI